MAVILANDLTERVWY